jgi:hypothetical protein
LFRDSVVRHAIPVPHMPRQPIGDRPMTAAERQRKHRALLRELNKPVLSPQEQRAQQEAAELMERVAQLEATLAARAASAARAARKSEQPAKPRAAPEHKADRAEIDRLQAENDELQQKVFNLKLHLDTLSGVLTRRTGAMTRAEYNSILSCLHPNSRKSVSDRKLADTFTLFNRFRYVLCNNDEMPIPKNYRLTLQEMEARRRYADAKKAADRRAKREARQAAKTPAAKTGKSHRKLK